jgi:alginate O-acetyltransferase complex protein AlgI
MSWQPAYALLIAFTTIVSYWIGLKSETKDRQKRKYFLWLSLSINLGVLFFFKYFNFLNDSIRELIHYTTGTTYEFSGLDVLLPVGISFYTFQTLSYNLDIYYGLRKPEKHLGIYALYVSFFPQLVAGPIERSTALLPQFKKETHFDWNRFGGGIKYLIWGIFKKVVIADRLSVYVNEIYNNSNEYHGGALGFATFLFAFQLYCDFSAYSDIAKGSAKILGYDLMENFDHPFMSKNITEFWRRWHISLSTWLRDYLYTPIVFKHKKWGKKSVMYAIFITFILCGLWHGAKFTFIIFGFLQAMALIYELATIELRKRWKEVINSRVYNAMSLVLTFIFILFSFLFFRADNTEQAIEIVRKLFSADMRYSEIITSLGNAKIRFLLVSMLLLFFILSDKKIYELVKGTRTIKPFYEQALFGSLFALILIFAYFGEVEFIYFQF